MAQHTGRHFLQIPGPTNVPDRVLRAIDRPTIDHRGPEFAELGIGALADMREVFATAAHVVIFPASGTGAWEAAIVNTLSVGDAVLMFETGQFAALWRQVAERMGLKVDFVPGDWRHAIDPADLERRLRADPHHAIKAVMAVHNETSTGILNPIADIRAAIDRANHPALLMVDTVSSLGSADYRHDEWRVDVAVAGSQKGLMLPPGLAFNAISDKALEAGRTAGMHRSYWDWQDMLAINPTGFFPYTPATNLLYGLREACAMLREEGLPHVFARHQRHAAATRAAVTAWGLDNLALEHHSPAVTAILLPDGHDADAYRKIVLEHFDMSLGTGLAKVKGKVFRIGHLGHFNDLMLMGTLAGVEMGLHLAAIPHHQAGVRAAMNLLTNQHPTAQQRAA